MRILVITNLFPRPGRPGMAAYNRQQFDALALNHDLEIVAPVPWTERITGGRLPTSYPRAVAGKTVRVHHPTFYFPPRFLSPAYGEFFLTSIQTTANRVVREFHPQVVLASWAHPDGWAAVRVGRRFGLPVVIKVVGSDVLVVTRNPLRRARVAEALRAADAVAAVSRDLATHVVALGAAPSRVHVVPEGVDVALFAPGDRHAARARLGLPVTGRLVLFVGNVLMSKGAGVLVEACARLATGEAEFHCRLVGRGADAAAVRELAIRLGVADRVTLAGECPQDRLPDWYRAADVVALPSFSEGIPNVLREALACGRPFVATSVGGVPEITRPPAGRLVEPGDPVALAAALRAVLDDPPAVDPAAFRDLCRTWDQSAHALADLLQQVYLSRVSRAPSTRHRLGTQRPEPR